MKVYAVVYGGEIDSIWNCYEGAEKRKEAINVFIDKGLKDGWHFDCNAHIETHEVEEVK